MFLRRKRACVLPFCGTLYMSLVHSYQSANNREISWSICRLPRLLKIPPQYHCYVHTAMRYIKGKDGDAFLAAGGMEIYVPLSALRCQLHPTKLVIHPLSLSLPNFLRVLHLRYWKKCGQDIG